MEHDHTARARVQRRRRRGDVDREDAWRERLDSMPGEWLEHSERWFDEAAELVRHQHEQRSHIT